VGGYDGGSRHCLSSVECYNPEGDTWNAVTDMSCRRSGAGNLYSVSSVLGTY
jgi:kelch-like protein 2/3